MKQIPKFLNKGKLPQIRIGNRWVDLESKGNGELTAGGRSYTVKKDSKSTSATGNKELVVTPKRNKVVDKNKVRENNKKVMSQHRSAFNGSDILYPVKKGFEVIGRGLYDFGQGVERAASQVSPYGSIRPTNPNWMEAPTPITDATFLYVLPATAPSRLVGTLRTGMAPWNPENPGFGNEDVNLLFDVVAGPKIVPAEMRLIKKGAGKTFKYALKVFSEERPAIDMTNNIDLSHIRLTEPLLSDLFQSAASSKIIFKSPKLTITKANVDDFWKRVGNLTEKEMVELGFMRPHPGTNLHVVIMDGKPMGSYERIYRPYRPKVEIAEVTEKPVQPLLKGKARKAQLERIWADAERELEPMKSQHPIPSKTTKFEDVTNATLEELINNLFTKEGRIELPLTWQELERNPELMKFVEELGKKGVPILEETGEPIIGKIDQNGNIVPTDRLASLLAYRTGNNSQIGAKSSLMNDVPFMEGFRGTQPLLERETLLPNGQLIEGGTKAFGDLNFSSDNLLGALNYADVLNHDLLLYVINSLRARGYNIPEQSVDYVAELINNIRTRQMPKTNPKQKGFKLGGHREEFRTGLKFPRSQHGETDGVGNTDAKRLGGIWRSIDNPLEADWADYTNDMVRYNRFFGPEQGHGGVQTVVSRRPRFSWEEPADLQGRRFSEPVLYKGKLYDDIHTLEQYLGNNGGFYGLDVINGRNPLLMRTLIAPRGSYFYGWGLKKGGKLLKKSKIIPK